MAVGSARRPAVLKLKKKIEGKEGFVVFRHQHSFIVSLYAYLSRVNGECRSWGTHEGWRVYFFAFEYLGGISLMGGGEIRSKHPSTQTASLVSEERRRQK